MRAGNRSEDDDQDIQAGARGNRIRQQRHRQISLGELFPHDSRTNHDRQQHGCSNDLRDHRSRQHHCIRPISSSFSLRASLLSVSNGKLTNSEMRR